MFGYVKTLFQKNILRSSKSELSDKHLISGHIYNTACVFPRTPTGGAGTVSVIVHTWEECGKTGLCCCLHLGLGFTEGLITLNLLFF